ncbi:MAG: thioredoxin family protein [Candidatus Omnitrophota bacterium]
MPIKTVEIMCMPCPKCEDLKMRIVEIINSIERENKIKIVYELKHTPTLKDIGKYSLNPSQVPVLIVNGNVESAGKIEPNLLKNKLYSLQKTC